MNLRDRKTQVFLIVALVFIGAYYLWFTQVFSPYNDQVAAKKLQKQDILTQLRDVEKKAATLPELERELADLQRSYRKIQLLLPDKKEIEAFLSQLHAAGQLTSSVVTDITPLGATSMDFYESNSYTVKVKSSYHGLGKFLSRIANMPFIVNLSDISIESPNKTLTSGQRVETDRVKPVEASFKLSTYNVKQGPAL